MGILGFAEDISGGFLWKAGAVAGGVAAVGLGITALVERVQVGSLKHDNAVLTDSIYNPKTGFLASIAVERTNTLTVRTALDRQNANLLSQAASDKAVIDDLRIKVDSANKAAILADAKYRDVLSKPLTGATVCDRYDEVDQRVLGLLR